MRKEWMLIAAIAATCTACENLNNQSNPQGAEKAGNQTENESDRRITESIQQALAKDTSLSNGGKNIKVTTKNGIVTLQGYVENNDEQTRILNIVGAQKGIIRLDNELNVKKPF